MKTLFILVLFGSCLVCKGQQEKAVRRDSLALIGDKWETKAQVYYDSALGESDLSAKVRQLSSEVKCLDSAHYYITWSEEVAVDFIKDMMQLEGMKLYFLRLELKPIDSSKYKQWDTIYKLQREQWISHLKHQQ